MQSPIRLLVPIDFSDITERILGTAITIASAAHAKVHLLHVVEPAYKPFEQIQSEYYLQAVKDVEALVERLKQENIDVTGEVLYGDAPVVICTCAADMQATMICIGTHGRSGFDRLIFGSTTDYVLRKGSTAVLCVPVGEMITGK